MNAYVPTCPDGEGTRLFSLMRAYNLPAPAVTYQKP